MSEGNHRKADPSGATSQPRQIESISHPAGSPPHFPSRVPGASARVPIDANFDAEELSGSLLVEEPTGSAARPANPAGPGAAPRPPAGRTSHPPPLRPRPSHRPSTVPPPLPHPAGSRSVPPPIPPRSGRPLPRVPASSTPAGGFASPVSKPPPLPPAIVNGAPPPQDDARGARSSGPNAHPEPASARFGSNGEDGTKGAVPFPHPERASARFGSNGGPTSFTPIAAPPPPEIHELRGGDALPTSPDLREAPGDDEREAAGDDGEALSVDASELTIDSRPVVDPNEFASDALREDSEADAVVRAAAQETAAQETSDTTRSETAAPAGADVFSTLPLPTLVAATSPPRLQAAEQAARAAAPDPGSRVEDSRPSPAPAGERISSSLPQLALAPFAILLIKLKRAARAAAAYAGHRYRALVQRESLAAGTQSKWASWAARIERAARAAAAYAGHRYQALVRREGLGTQPKWVLPAAAAGGLGVGIALVAFTVSIVGRHKARGARETSTAASFGLPPRLPLAGSAPSSATAAPEPPASAPAGEPAQPPPALAACTVAAPPKVLAPNALVSAGIEVRATGADVALGFAAGEHQAEVLRVDPSTLSVSSTVASRSRAAIGRVTPFASANDVVRALVDGDRKLDPLHGRRTVPIPSFLQVGEAGNHFVWARSGAAAAGTLWPLDGTDEVDAVRASSENSGDDWTTAIAFRRAGSIEVGLATGLDAFSAKGDLSKFAGLGPAVGAPAVAINDGVVLVAWADRPSADDPWRLRWVRFKAGETPGEPASFDPPADRGGQAMAPSVTTVPGRRFLLLWTEGPPSQHEVRGVTLSEDGARIGAPLVLSSDGFNAGQGQAAVTSEGRGIVAFLESVKGHFEVAATPIQCEM